MNTQQEIENINDLINRYKQRIRALWTRPNPYYKSPLWEASEINQKIKQLEAITKNK